MDVSKLQERLTPKKIKPIAAIVIVEVMLFLFSFESMLEWFQISPKLFIFFMVIASYFVFVVLEYLKQEEDKRTWWKAMRQLVVFGRVILAVVIFALLFLVYIIFLPEYKVIALTGFKKQQFSETNYEKYTHQDYLDELSAEVKVLIGSKYKVKIDDNLSSDEVKNSRLIIVPGIFNHEEAVETIQQLEERLVYFMSSKEESQVPMLYQLYKEKTNLFKKEHLSKNDFNKLIDRVKFEIQFTDKVKGSNKDEGRVYSSDKGLEFSDRKNETVKDKINRLFNNIKYTLNL